MSFQPDNSIKKSRKTRTITWAAARFLLAFRHLAQPGAVPLCRSPALNENLHILKVFT